MPTEADRFLEENQEQTGSEESTEETTEKPTEQSEAFDAKAAFEDLQSKMSAMIASMNKQPAEAPKPAFKLTPEQAEAFKDNPALLVEFVQQQSQASEQAIAKQMQRQHWDNRANADFPMKDKEFQKHVVKEIESLISSGDMTKESPSLVYNAAKMALASYKPKDGGSVKKGAGDSSLPPRGAGTAKPAANAEKEKKESQMRTFLRLADWSEEKITKVLGKSESERGVRHIGNKRRRVIDLPLKSQRRR